MFVVEAKRLCFALGLDDRQGNRTVEAIPNKQGIVKFHIWYDFMSDVSMSEPYAWIDVELDTEYKVSTPLSSYGVVMVRHNYSVPRDFVTFMIGFVLRGSIILYFVRIPPIAQLFKIRSTVTLTGQ